MNAKSRVNKPTTDSKTGRPVARKINWQPKTTLASDLQARAIRVTDGSEVGERIKQRLLRRANVHRSNTV